MDEIRFVIDGSLPGLNEYLNGCKAGKRNGAQIKRQTDTGLMWILRSQFKGQLEGCYDVDFVWYEKDKRRDHDNICSARKFIFDAMVGCGMILNDGWRYVGNFTDRFEVDKLHPRVEMILRRRADG